MKKALSVLIALAMLDWWAGAFAPSAARRLETRTGVRRRLRPRGMGSQRKRRPNRRGWACKHFALTGAQVVIDLPAATLTPGLIEGHPTCPCIPTTRPSGGAISGCTRSA